MPICTAVVGAGRMGTVMAAQLPVDTKKIIIDIDLEKARLLARQVGAIPSDRLESAGDADLVAVVLPTPVVNETVYKLLDVVKGGGIILNMATTAHIDPSLFEKNKKVTIVDAKIIGHAKSITKGEPGIIVVNSGDESVFGLIKDQLPGFHKVVQGDSDLVERINRVGSTEGIKAAVKVRNKLLKLDIPDEWINVAIRTVCAGTAKSFAENDLGHFALELVKKLETFSSGNR
jgi:hypothetical protein